MITNDLPLRQDGYLIRGEGREVAAVSVGGWASTPTLHIGATSYTPTSVVGEDALWTLTVAQVAAIDTAFAGKSSANYWVTIGTGDTLRSTHGGFLRIMDEGAAGSGLQVTPLRLVVGPPGRSVESLTIVDGHLIATMSGGAEIDGGPVPIPAELMDASAAAVAAAGTATTKAGDAETARAAAVVAKNAAEAAAAPAALDATVAGNVTTPGSLTNTALSATYAARRGQRVVLFGDSHVEGTSGSAASDWRTSRNYPLGGAMFAWAIWLSNSRLQFWGNYGVGGERTDQVYARIGEVLASGGDLVLLQMGTNDSRQGYALSHTQTYYRATVDAILAAGMDVLIAGVPPCVDGQDAQDKINAWLKWYAAEMNVPFVDTFAAVADPTTRAIAAAYDTGDHVHLNSAGSKVVGQLVADAIAGPRAPIAWGAGSNIDATNIVPNSWGLTDATSDGIPDGWSALGTPTGGTATHTLETVTDWPGKAICIEQAANTNARQLYKETNISTGKFAVGDLMRASIHIKNTGAIEAMAWVSFSGSSTGRTMCRLATIRTATDGITSAVEFRVPAGTTSLAFYLYTSAGTGKAYFGQPTLTNLTALGITSGLE